MARQGSTDKESTGEGNSAGEIKYHELIACERRRLQKARAVLDCLAVGLEYELDIDFADVATVVSALIGEAIANLDSTALEARRGRLGEATVHGGPADSIASALHSMESRRWR